MPPRSRAASPRSPRSALTCSAGPDTATAPAIRAGTGAPSCCSSAPATGPSPGSAWPTPSSSANASRPGRCWNDQPANRPAPGTAVVTDKGLSGEDTEEFFASDDLSLTLIRPARKDEKQPRYFPNWLRQRVEAIIWTLKNQLGLERHGGRVPAGLWARIIQRLLALNTAIWHNWLIGAPVKRSLIAYDHVSP